MNNKFCLMSKYAYSLEKSRYLPKLQKMYKQCAATLPQNTFNGYEKTIYFFNCIALYGRFCSAKCRRFAF